jgi:hypothetical protein
MSFCSPKIVCQNFDRFESSAGGLDGLKRLGEGEVRRPGVDLINQFKPEFTDKT